MSGSRLRLEVTVGRNPRGGSRAYTIFCAVTPSPLLGTAAMLPFRGELKGKLFHEIDRGIRRFCHRRRSVCLFDRPVGGALVQGGELAGISRVLFLRFLGRMAFGGPRDMMFGLPFRA